MKRATLKARLMDEVINTEIVLRNLWHKAPRSLEWSILRPLARYQYNKARKSLLLQLLVLVAPVKNEHGKRHAHDFSRHVWEGRVDEAINLA